MESLSVVPDALGRKQASCRSTQQLVEFADVVERRPAVRREQPFPPPHRGYYLFLAVRLDDALAVSVGQVEQVVHVVGFGAAGQIFGEPGGTAETGSQRDDGTPGVQVQP